MSIDDRHVARAGKRFGFFLLATLLILRWGDPLTEAVTGHPIPSNYAVMMNWSLLTVNVLLLADLFATAGTDRSLNIVALLAQPIVIILMRFAVYPLLSIILPGPAIDMIGPTTTGFSMAMLGAAVTLLAMFIAILVVAYSSGQVNRKVLIEALIRNQYTTFALSIVCGNIVTAGFLSLSQLSHPAIALGEVAGLAISLRAVFDFFKWFGNTQSISGLADACAELNDPEHYRLALLTELLKDAARQGSSPDVNKVLTLIPGLVEWSHSGDISPEKAVAQRKATEALRQVMHLAVQQKNQHLITQVVAFLQHLDERLSDPRGDWYNTSRLLNSDLAKQMLQDDSPEYVFENYEFNSTLHRLLRLLQRRLEARPRGTWYPDILEMFITMCDIVSKEVRVQLVRPTARSTDHLRESFGRLSQIMFPEQYLPAGASTEDWYQAQQCGQEWYALTLSWLLSDVLQYGDVRFNWEFVALGAVELSRFGPSVGEVLFSPGLRSRYRHVFSEHQVSPGILGPSNLDSYLGKVALVWNLFLRSESASASFVPAAFLGTTAEVGAMVRGIERLSDSVLAELLRIPAKKVAGVKREYSRHLSKISGPVQCRHETALSEHALRPFVSTIEEGYEGAKTWLGELRNIQEIQRDSPRQSVVIHQFVSSRQLSDYTASDAKRMGERLAATVEKCLLESVKSSVKDTRVLDLREKTLTEDVTGFCIQEAVRLGLDPLFILSSAPVRFATLDLLSPWSRARVGEINIYPVGSPIPSRYTVVINRRIVERVALSKPQIRYGDFHRQSPDDQEPIVEVTAEIGIEWISAFQSQDIVWFEHPFERVPRFD